MNKKRRRVYTPVCYTWVKVATAVVGLTTAVSIYKQEWLLWRTWRYDVFVTRVRLTQVIHTSVTTTYEQKYDTYIILYHTYILHTSYMHHTYIIRILYISYTYFIHYVITPRLLAPLLAGV